MAGILINAKKNKVNKKNMLLQKMIAKIKINMQIMPINK